MSHNTMYRSASWTRVGDDSGAQASVTGLRASPTAYEAKIPAAETTKKEKPRSKLAENGVHVIPFVLLVCALILWFFSNPDVEVGIKGETVAAKMEGLSMEGDIDNDSDGTQTGVLPSSDLPHSDATATLRTSTNTYLTSNSRKLVKGFH